MEQTTYVRLNGVLRAFSAPDPEACVIDGIPWGRVGEILTPASWAFQCGVQEQSNEATRFRMGATLEEEFAICLLAGYGVPAEIGIAAADRLRDRGMLDASRSSSEEEILDLLAEPLDIGGRKVRYRFFRTKSRHLYAGLQALRYGRPDEHDALSFRAWFHQLSGVGPKTASFITRNWLGSDHVAILDIHVMRACQAFGLFGRDADVSRNYAQLECKFVAFARALGVRASTLDAVMWEGMRMLSASTIEAYSPVGAACEDGDQRRSVSTTTARQVATGQGLLT